MGDGQHRYRASDGLLYRYLMTCAECGGDGTVERQPVDHQPARSYLCAACEGSGQCWRTRAPTPADIVAHLAAQPDGGDALLRELLRADPDRAVRVVDGADIARPWDDGRREPLNALGGHPVAEVVVGELVTEWLVGDTLGTIADGESRTAEAAEAAADAALLADGWVLAGGGR